MSSWKNALEYRMADIVALECTRAHHCRECGEHRDKCWKTTSAPRRKLCTRCFRRIHRRAFAEGRVFISDNDEDRDNDGDNDEDANKFVAAMLKKACKHLAPAVLRALPGSLEAAKQASIRAGAMHAGGHALASGLAVTGVIDEHPSMSGAMLSGGITVTGAAVSAGVGHLVSSVANEHIANGIARIEREMGVVVAPAAVADATPSWQCIRCTLVNAASAAKCVACDGPAPGATIAVQPTPGAATPRAVPSSPLFHEYWGNDALDDIDGEPAPAPAPPTASARAPPTGRARLSETDFLCPITCALMVEPVIAADGHSYERAAIECWLVGHDTSPMTGGRLDHRHVTPNHQLRSLILRYQEATVSVEVP